MKKTFIRALALLFAALMLFCAFGCNETPEPAETTPENTEPEVPAVDTSWLKGLDEKIAALSNYYGRNMSVARGGNSVDFAPASREAIESAVELGADAIGISVQKTSDGVLIALPANDFFGTTDVADKKGTNGLPSSTSVKSWSSEQIKELKLKNMDGSVSESGILTLAEVLEICKDKCFVYIDNVHTYEADSYSELYAVAKASGAYSAFMVTPGTRVMAKWSEMNPSDSALAETLADECKAFLHAGMYFDIRKPASVKDNESGWANAHKGEQTFVITDKIEEYVEWVAKNFKSALVYQPDAFDSLTYSIEKEDLTARYLLISDVHYNTVEGTSKYVHAVTYRGYHNDERMVFMCAEIEREYNERGLDAIFVLGDLSTDDPPFGSKPNHVKMLWDRYLKPLSDKLGIPILAVGGNHDGYYNQIWKPIVGTDRQHVWENKKTGDVFIMLDTYNPLTASENKSGSGVAWSGIDEKWLETQLEKYKDSENVFLLSHYFGSGTSTEEFVSDERAQLEALIKKYRNVRALYDGHTHRYKVSAIAGVPIINTGAYSYDCVYDEARKVYNFDNLDLDNLWGFNILETSAESVVSYRVNTEHYYVTKFVPADHYNPYKKFEDTVIR